MKMSMKELTDTIGDWKKTIDKIKLDFLSAYYESTDTDLMRLHKTLHYYERVNNNKYICGDVIINLKDIANYMIKRLDDWKDESLSDWNENTDGEKFDENEFNEECHSAGYGGMEEYRRARQYWENLDDNSIINLAKDNTDDKISPDILDGHRNYWVTQSELYPMLFNYVFYTLKKEDGDRLFGITEFYPIELYLPSVEEMNILYDRNIQNQQNKTTKRYNDMIGNIIENFKDNEYFIDKIKILQTLKIQ